MKRLSRTLLALVLAATALAAGPAAAQDWQIDPAHSSVTFQIRHLFTKVTGRFADVKGTLHFNPARPEAASVRASISVSSIDTENEKRDQHLRSTDFFSVEKYPEIIFQSTQVETTGENLRITGDLTMHGVTKPVVLDAEFLGSGPHPMRKGAQVAGFTAITKVDRREFGIQWNRTLDQGGALLGNKVNIRIDIEAVQPAKE